MWEMQGLQRDLQLNEVAWMTARQRLSAMCPNPPDIVGPYLMQATLNEQGFKIIDNFVVAQRATKKDLENDGKNFSRWLQDPGTPSEIRNSKAAADIAQDCALRVIKLSGGASVDDWGWGWLPSYTLIISIHEEEVRNRHQARYFEEYIFGLARYLAEQADRGAITEQQLMAAFNEGWKWMIGKLQEDYLLLQQNIAAGEKADTAVWNTLSSVAVGLAVVATAALVASAAVNASRPAPVNCYAYPTGGGNYYVQCN
jgi:hypothetical protein